MTETLRCPDCGNANPAGAESCSACNFPLQREPLSRRTDAAPSPSESSDPAAASGAADGPADPIEPAAPAEPATSTEPAIEIRRPRPRPRRANPADQMSVSLWLMFGAIAAVTVIWIGVKANVDRARIPVEGSSPDQQARADAFRERLAADSTDIESRVGLANVLYDTGNWNEAASHYRYAIARDSSLVTAIVDLGVCYYNMSRPNEASDLFHLALRRDPHQPIALFNLGIVNERGGDLQAALGFYHRALQTDPPEEMKEPLMEALQRVYQASGKQAPPLPDGRPPEAPTTR